MSLLCFAVYLVIGLFFFLLYWMSLVAASQPEKEERCLQINEPLYTEK